MTGLRDRGAWLALALTLGGWAATRADAPAPAVFPAESKATAGRIDDIRKLLADRKWPEAVEEIQAVLTASGDDLIPVGPGRCVGCRRLCHALLASLPPDALRSYRNGADPQAKKQLDQAVAGRDVRLLRKVVDEAFCSRPAEKALDLLGDLAFERGDFAEAEQWWRLLSPPKTAKAEQPPALLLYYPDPQTDAARTRAKVLLARLFAGAPPHNPPPKLGEGREGDDLEAYRKDFGTAEGALAGKTGRYADILAQVADERRADLPAPTAAWPTFGGDSARGRVAVAPPRLLDRLGALCRPANERQYSLKDRQPLDEDPVYDRGGGAILANRSMAFEPVVADGKAIVADAQYVTAYDLRTGAVENWYDAAHLNGGVHPDRALPAPPDLRYTVTVAGDRAFVRLGTQTVRDVRAVDRDAKNRDNQSLLVCLSLRPTRIGERFLWAVDASAPENAGADKAEAVFEGSPLVHDGLVAIASTRFVNGRPITRIHCYPADAAEEPPELWHQDICETHEFADKDRRYRQHLLTLAGSYLVYCSHSGAIVALDAVTGKPAWSVRYPSRGDSPLPSLPPRVGEGGVGASPRDLAPCLFADGRLYVAPADYDHLLCLDPATGEKLWDRGPLEVVHLLGVGERRLIFTTPMGLRAVDADDGVDAWALPDGGGGLAPAGRGLLIGDLVLWPTASKGPGSTTVYAVRQRDGEQPDDPSLLSRIPAGNLVYADGCLLSADRQVLTIFAPPGKEGPSRSEKHTARMDAARQAVAAGRWEEAAADFKQASTDEFSAPVRLQTLLDEAALWKKSGQADRAVAVWQGLGGADAFRGLIVEDETGVPQSAAAFAAARLGQAPKLAGPAAADAPERPAAADPPLFRTWQATLDPGEDALALAGDLLLCGRSRPAGRLTGRSADSGKLRWQAALPFAPTWAGRRGDVIVTAGEGGAAAVSAEDGRVAWQFAAPPPSRTLPDEAGLVLAPDAGRPDPLGNFHLIGGCFCCIQGERRIFVLDAECGRVLWARRAAGAGLRQPYPGGRFLHAVPAGAGLLLVQTSGGRRWLLDAATGRLLHDDPTASEPWPRPPVRLSDGRILLTPDARTVVLLDPTADREVWTYTLPGATTRTGEAPRLSAGPDALLLAWATNIGWRVQRLDPASGQPTWAESPLFNVQDLDLDGWSQDADAFYGVQDRVLFARSLKDGAVLWRQPAAGPRGRWRTLRRRQPVRLPRPDAGRTISIPLAVWAVTMGRSARPGRGTRPGLPDRVL